MTADSGYGQASVERDLQELGVRTVTVGVEKLTGNYVAPGTGPGQRG